MSVKPTAKNGNEKLGYVLGGSRLANSRLNLQCFSVMESYKPHLLHPPIPYQKPNLKIADICCGTGIWLNALRSQTDPSTKLYGLDLNLSNMPPNDWLPPLTETREHDIFDLPPSDLVEAFDVINIQFALAFVQDGQFSSVLDNLLKFLKPGGWIQWTEFRILTNICLSLLDPSYKPVWASQIFNGFWKMYNVTPPSYMLNMDDRFRSHGLQEVYVANVNHTDPSNRAMLWNWTEQTFMGCEELLEAVSNKAEGDEEAMVRTKEYRELLDKAYDECKEKGVACLQPLTRVIGTKER